MHTYIHTYIHTYARAHTRAHTHIHTRTLQIDLGFTVVFTLELMLNMVAHWFHAFFYDGWNIFDLVVILVSWVAYLVAELPGFQLMRLTRVFRVIRLFKKLESMRIIITALSSSVYPVFNAFVIMLLS